MNIERTRKIFGAVAIAVLIFAIAVVAAFVYLFVTQPQIVPSGETFGSFWLKNFAILLAALTFASSALAISYNALEQRHLRYMENYPYLVVFPIHTVDPLPLPIPTADVPGELKDFDVKYLAAVAPAQQPRGSDINFRYLAIVLRNVGHGHISQISMQGIAEVPNQRFEPISFHIERRVDLPPGTTLPFTLLPISELPQYKVRITSLEYRGHFVKMTDFDGVREFNEAYPYSIPPERRVILFLDDFHNAPSGLGWVMDFWGQWQPNGFCYVPLPVGNDHYMILTGTEQQFSTHYKGRGGAHVDIRDALQYGQTVQALSYARGVARFAEAFPGPAHV